jgi:YkoP domain
MFTLHLKKRGRDQALPLTETQRRLVETKFEILRQASFGFTQDRLLHLQEDDLKGWTNACTGELHKRIASAAPSDVQIALIDFRVLRCISLQCLPIPMNPPASILNASTTNLNASTTNAPELSNARPARVVSTAPLLVGSAARIQVQRSHRRIRLADGTTIRLGDPVGVLHLNDSREFALHADGLLPVEVGPAFRRQLLGSLHELARLAGPGGRLIDVKAFFATTIFLHEGFKQLGFEAEDRAPAWLRPRSSTAHRARRLWISRKTLLVRYGAAASLGA